MREQYSVLCGDLNGKEIQKKGGIRVWLIHFAVQLKLIHHDKANILQYKFIKK